MELNKLIYTVYKKLAFNMKVLLLLALSCICAHALEIFAVPEDQFNFITIPKDIDRLNDPEPVSATSEPSVDDNQDITEWSDKDIFEIYDIKTSKSTKGKPSVKRPKADDNDDKKYTFKYYDNSCIYYLGKKEMYMKHGDKLYVRSDINLDRKDLYTLGVLGCSMLTQRNKEDAPIITINKVNDDQYKSIIKPEVSINFLREIQSVSTIFYKSFSLLNIDTDSDGNVIVGLPKPEPKSGSGKRQVDDSPSDDNSGGNANRYALCLMNKIRKHHNKKLVPLRGSYALDYASQVRSDMQAKFRGMHHKVCKNGKGYFQADDDDENQCNGILFEFIGTMANNPGAENIAVAQEGKLNKACDALGKLDKYQVKDNSTAIIYSSYSWCESEGHYNNIVKEDLRYVGFGSVSGSWKGRNSWYSTQDFAYGGHKSNFYDEDCNFLN